MIPFRNWMEQRENNSKETILALLGLDDDGLGVPLEAFESKDILHKLEPLGFFQTLPAEKQSAIRSMIEKGIGTVGELIDKLEAKGNDVETSSMLPPQGEPEKQPRKPEPFAKPEPFTLQ